uniref:Cellular oncogene fos n=1 Tax=Plectus sambesii TaxID=2011161 RepID=A0A914V1P1_9BILA
MDFVSAYLKSEESSADFLQPLFDCTPHLVDTNIRSSSSSSSHAQIHVVPPSPFVPSHLPQACSSATTTSLPPYQWDDISMGSYSSSAVPLSSVPLSSHPDAPSYFGFDPARAIKYEVIEEPATYTDISRNAEIATHSSTETSSLSSSSPFASSSGVVESPTFSQSPTSSAVCQSPTTFA